MDFSLKARVRPEKKTAADDLEQLYPHSVMLYRIPPIQDISLQMFEDLAIERLKVFRILEQASSKNLRYNSDEWKDSIIQELNQQNLKLYVRLILHGGSTVSSAKRDLDLLARQHDYISHFILRFAYAKSDDLQRWFISREMELFRLKFSNLTPHDITKFLEVNNLKYTPLTDDEVNEIKDSLYESTAGNNLIIEKLDFYKVAFGEVLDLVKARKCFLKDGYAYVSTHDFMSVVASKHEHYIQLGLQSALLLLPEIETDDRIFGLVKGLHTSHTGKDYTLGSADNVPIECIDQLSKKSFPLCMRTCHETLRIKHHHKYNGRLQYGAFLKGIGVTLEDALRFWQEEFTKIMEFDRFTKDYAYNIRHLYGKVGSMINYSPWSCMKIITSSVSPQDTHGCPYSTMETSALRTKLAGYGLSANHIQEILAYSSKGHYQLACGRYFEITMETKLTEGINHPNQYFELSQRIMADRASTKSSLTGKKPALDGTIVLKTQKKNTDTRFDPRYDDELWAAMDKGLESYNSQKTQMQQMDEDDFDVSQLPDEF